MTRVAPKVDHPGVGAAVRTQPSPRVPPHLLDNTAVVFCLVASAGLTAYALAVSSPTAALWSTLIVFGALLFWSVRHPGRGTPLLFYLLAAFTFLVGRIAVTGILGFQATSQQPWGLHVSDPDAVTQVLVMVQVFLVCVFVPVAYHSGRSARRIHAAGTPAIRADKIGAVVGLGAMAVGSPLFLENRLSVVGAVSSSSYSDFYLNQSELVSPTGRLGDALLLVGFAFLLASWPTWRMFLVGSLIIVTCHGVDLVMGRRADFVLTALLVAFYAVFRAGQRVVHRGVRVGWPSRRTLALLSLLAIPFITLLDAVGNSRNQVGAASAQEHTNPLLQFFFDQGVTANILGFVQADMLDIPEDRIYSVGPLVEFVQTRLVPGFDDSLYASQTAARALEGHQFADLVSYQFMPTAYLQGSGYGSSAVAELFVDFGWPGIIIGGAIIGLLLVCSARVLDFSVPVSAFFLLVFRDLLYTPRAPFLHWLVGSLNVFNIAALVLVFCTWRVASGLARGRRLTVGSAA